jgi:hypothetical protein
MSFTSVSQGKFLTQHVIDKLQREDFGFMRQIIILV